MELKLDRQQKTGLASALRTYLVAELEVEIGNLQCEMLLEHLGKLVGPVYYNQGLRDAQAAMLRRLDDAAADIDVLEQPLRGR